MLHGADSKPTDQKALSQTMRRLFSKKKWVQAIIAGFSGAVLPLTVVVAAPSSPLVATVHPVYLIARAITKGVEEPIDLLPSQSTGHDIQLTPKQRQLLDQSDLVLWVDPSYEVSLAPLLKENKKAVQLSKTPGLKKLPLRDKNGMAIVGTLDPHIWLNRKNAIKMAWYIAEIRSRQFPKYQKVYQRNYQAFARSLSQNQNQKSIPHKYIAYHDAYQYLEQDNGLQLTDALVNSEQQTPSAAQLKALADSSLCAITGNQSQLKTVQRVHAAPNIVISEVLSDYSSYLDAVQDISNRSNNCVGK